MEDDEQKTVKPTSQAPPAQSAEPDASKLRKMSMSSDNAARLAREQFK